MNHFCIAPIVVVLAISGGCDKPAAPTAEEVPQVALVKVCNPKKQAVGGTQELIGVTQPLPGHSARICAGVEGRIVSILGDGRRMVLIEGQHVNAGQIIAKLDDRIAAANVRKLQAALKDVAAQLVQADLAVQMAKIEVDRLDAMATTKAGRDASIVPETVIEKAKLQLKDAVSKRDSVVAKGASSDAELAVAKEQLALCELRTPIAGELGIFDIQLGQSLAVGAAVGSVVDLDHVDVVCIGSPSTIRNLAVGQTATIASSDEEPSGHSETAVGKIAFVSNQGQPDTGGFTVKARFANSQHALRANAVVHISVTTIPDSQKMTLPIECLLEDAEKPSLLLVEIAKADDKDAKEHKDDKPDEKQKSRHDEKPGDKDAKKAEPPAKKLIVHKRQAIVGLRDRRRHVVEILGLVGDDGKEEKISEAQQFVVERGFGLHDGDEVKLEEPKPAEAKEADAKASSGKKDD